MLAKIILKRILSDFFVGLADIVQDTVVYSCELDGKSTSFESIHLEYFVTVSVATKLSVMDLILCYARYRWFIEA